MRLSDWDSELLSILSNWWEVRLIGCFLLCAAAESCFLHRSFVVCEGGLRFSTVSWCSRVNPFVFFGFLEGELERGEYGSTVA